MPNNEEDPGLAVLREIYDQQTRSIPFGLVQEFYELEKRYQYEDDREVPTAMIRSLVSVAVERDLAVGDAPSEGEK
jgi:hypothetical protein